MIIVKLIGGLGNQMFQYAAARHLSHLRETPLLFDTSYIDKDPGGAYTKREMELDAFNIQIVKATQSEIDFFDIPHSNKITRSLQRNFPSFFKNVYAAESGSSFNKHFFKFPKNTYLEGFWQSEKYFLAIREIILNDFTLKNKLDTEYEKYLHQIQSLNAVSLHVRRGDYVSNEFVKQHHGNLPLSYYQDAIKFLNKFQSNLDVFVFSDDIAWCRSHLNLEVNTHFVENLSGSNPHSEMYLMSKCKHHVVANSSFSWWGAWLNTNSSKIVVAPRKWYADSNLNTNDLIPKTWQIL